MLTIDLMLIAWVSIILAIAGLLVYVLSANGKAVELGRLMFFAGILAVALQAARFAIRIP